MGSPLAGTGLPAARPEAARRLPCGHRLRCHQPLQKTAQKLGFVFWQIQRKEEPTVSCSLTPHTWPPIKQGPHPSRWMQGGTTVLAWQHLSLLSVLARGRTTITTHCSTQHRGRHPGHSIPPRQGCTNSMPPPPPRPGGRTRSGFHGPFPPALARLPLGLPQYLQQRQRHLGLTCGNGRSIF